MVVAGVAAAALLALERRQRAALRHRQQRAQVERGVPARVVGAAAIRPRLRRALLEDLELLQRLLQLALGADDADQVLHDVLQLGLDRVRVLAAGA